MTLTEINKALSNLAEQPTRENVLAFSFELLQWMNITPNADYKPQLLSPQTQKLKDYLGNAPQTVQPQLYRLSADNQPIRVRFAVLKKLKKEYISQLVDNDPGLGSYQAMAKGLTTPPTGTAFIPAQPYFVHFVTTPDYDKLLLIFNQGEQKRIVSFRNRLTNTQYHKIIQAWQGIGTKAKPEIADLLWKSLDIKEVNKEFYKQIKERFDALLGIVKTQHSTATKNQVKQFTVRMIGRYIFCWFLKEKGIIPHSLISKQTIESTDKYYQTVLLKLFFETLNTKVQDRDPLKHNKLFEKIPYLNGGLFDESEEDKLFTKLDLDAWLLPFVEILESYDFTVDESSSQYQQVAVDPEMLGRIFENLLASQNEETEKLANQRKAFGAFYTPREIVDYMVNESIKAFLQTQWEQHIEADKTKHINNPEPIGDIFGNKKPQQLAIETKRYELKPEEKQKIENALEPLFASNSDAGHLKKDEKTLLLSFLEQIKILDPACGSGAFPMGILHKLVELHEAFGTVKSSYELKKDILSQNIYGVDIMPMAIEIARLRAWLSLVLEEDYKPNDPKHNFGVKPLPNLDFKFVCANSLIDLGLDAYIQESKGTLHEGFTQKLVKDLKDLETLRAIFFNPTLASSQKEKLKSDYFKRREKVVSDIDAAHDPILKQIALKIKHWNPFDDSYSSTFFSPTWMFGIDSGFDILIGNPPYVRIQNLSHEIIDTYKERFKTAWKRLDISTLFFEFSHNILNDNGHLCFISSNQFLKAEYGRKIRGFLKGHIKLNIDYSKVSVFEGLATYVSIFLVSKKISAQIRYKLIENLDERIDNFNSFDSFKFSNDPWDFNINEGLKEKLFFDKIPLSKIANFTYGVITGLDKAFLIGNEKAKELQLEEEITRTFIRPQNYKKFHVSNNTYLLIYPYNKDNSIISENELKKKFPNCFSYLKSFQVDLENRQDSRTTIKKKGVAWYSLIRKVDLKEIEVEKIIFYDVGMHPNFILDNNHLIFGGGTSHSIKITDKTFNIKYVISVLNSKLMEWIIYDLCPVKMGNARKYGLDYIKKLPLPLIGSTRQQPFIDRVDKILSLKKKNQDTASLEKELDVLVYHLYELTYEEVQLIDKDFWLSAEEYNNYKMQ